MALLQVEDLTFRYPDAPRAALQNVSFSVEAGELLVICGASGCGKSTLLRLIKRELAPFGEKSGEIRFDGLPQAQWDERASCAEIGFVQQRPEEQIVTDKVWHELAFGPESLGLPTAQIRRRVCETAAYFGIGPWFRQSTADLSGGQKQLLNLAAVTVMRPRLLLFDEPTAQLDPLAAAAFIDTVGKLRRELGIAVVLVEHRLEDVLPIADRAILMDGGRIAFDGAPRRFAAHLAQDNGHPVAGALPAAVRIFSALDGAGECPLTVGEGRRFLAAYCGSAARALPEEPPAVPGKTVLSARQIRFRYEKDAPDVLRDVSLDVYAGEHLCLLGGNGAGKTTLLYVLAGVRKPYAGSVTAGRRMPGARRAKGERAPRIALLPQDPQTVFLHKTVREDLAEAAGVLKLAREESDARICRTAERVGIAALLDRHPYDLSGGEQQLAALAKLLLTQPEFLLLDEPTKGIDAGGRARLAQILRDLQKDGMTVVTVTHDIEFAAANADRCAFLFDGEIVSAEPPRTFFPGNAFYTTAAARIAAGRFDGAVSCADVIRMAGGRIDSEKEDVR